MINISFMNDNSGIPTSLLEELLAMLKYSVGKLITVSIEIVRPTRSIVQNNYYWGVIIKMLSQEIGYDPEVVHDYMKKLFLGYIAVDMPDGKEHHQLRSTTDLTTAEAEDYYSKIRDWAGKFLNIYIPMPNETPLNYLELN